VELMEVMEEEGVLRLLLEDGVLNLDLVVLLLVRLEVERAGVDSFFIPFTTTTTTTGGG